MEILHKDEVKSKGEERRGEKEMHLVFQRE